MHWHLYYLKVEKCVLHSDYQWSFFFIRQSLRKKHLCNHSDLHPSDSWTGLKLVSTEPAIASTVIETEKSIGLSNFWKHQIILMRYKSTKTFLFNTNLQTLILCLRRSSTFAVATLQCHGFKRIYAYALFGIACIFQSLEIPPKD